MALDTGRLSSLLTVPSENSFQKPAGDKSKYQDASYSNSLVNMPENDGHLAAIANAFFRFGTQSTGQTIHTSGPIKNMMIPPNIGAKPMQLK
ncbi:MAG: hypothetical protein IPI77_23465 [Saprospiraceae bacterium]|nr:hypothetical protein [Saprospiraceae bacterium]